MGSARPIDPGVQLPPATSASALLHRILLEARSTFSALAAVDVPESAVRFRKTFQAVLPAFEAARAAAPARSEIALAVARAAATALVYRSPDGADTELAAHLSDSGTPLPLTVREPTAAPGLEPSIPFGDETVDRDGLPGLLDRLAESHRASPPAITALRWASARLQEGLDLHGEKFVVMGAGAELAPTPILLAAGAEVLWLDVVPPGNIPRLAARLHHCEGGADLLTQPREIVATIEAFAAGDPVHLGMYAYAAGRGREWRLEASMNAIARAVTRGLVKSISVYVSPTSPMVTHPADLAAATAARESSPLWQRLARSAGVLRPAHARSGDLAVGRSLVPLQGASYQAAQYVAKTLAAEAFAFAPDAQRRVPRVSVNVAGITNTSSMSEPVFQAAFLGAPRFGVHIFRPEATRWLSGLLMLHDLLHPDAAPDPNNPGALFERQLHGGVQSMPDAMEGAITVAALIGMGKRPGLAVGMLRR